MDNHVSHARWASFINFLAGVWIIISPYTLGYSSMNSALMNNMTFGAIIAILALVRIANAKRYESLSWINTILGLWIIVSPFIIGYPTVVSQLDNVVAGLVVAILGSRSATETHISSGRMIGV